jgi:ribosomal protein L21E
MMAGTRKEYVGKKADLIPPEKKSGHKFFRGQTVIIEYSIEFKKQYPHTFKYFNGKTGVITAFISDSGENLIAIKLPFQRIETLVDRSFIKSL